MDFGKGGRGGKVWGGGGGGEFLGGGGGGGGVDFRELMEVALCFEGDGIDWMALSVEGGEGIDWMMGMGWALRVSGGLCGSRSGNGEERVQNGEIQHQRNQSAA